MLPRARGVASRRRSRALRMTEAIARVAAEQGWGVDEATVADAARLEAWLQLRAEGGRPRARLEGRGRLPRRGVVGAPRADVPRQAGRPPLRDLGRAALGPRPHDALGADLRHRPPGRDLAARQGAPGPPARGRPLRALRGGHGDRERLLGAERPARAARALPRPAEGARAGRPRGAPDGRRLRPRPRPRPAADRRLRRRHRPPGHDPHRLARRSATSSSSRTCGPRPAASTEAGTANRPTAPGPERERDALPWELRVALRYLTARRKQAFISLISGGGGGRRRGRASWPSSSPSAS